jgi:hypothetical protein
MRLCFGPVGDWRASVDNVLSDSIFTLYLETVMSNDNPSIRIVISPDNVAESPREWENAGTMVCFHSRHNLGDEQPRCSPDTWMREFADELVNFKISADDIPEKHIRRVIDKHVCVMLPLNLYEHGGITMSTSPFSCPWDSGQVGYIYVTWERARKEWTGTDDEIRDLAERCLESEVEAYDQFIRGDVWGYVIEKRDEDDEDSEWESTDSCWGFFGDDPKKNGMIESWDHDVVEHFNEHGVEFQYS